VAGRKGAESRRSFLEDRVELHPGWVVDGGSGAVVGEVPAVELVTVGQRRGLGVAAGDRRFAVDVDVASRRVVVGDEEALACDDVPLTRRTWVDTPLAEGAQVEAQASAHGRPFRARVTTEGLAFAERRRRIAPGQLVGLYTGDRVVGSGIALKGAALEGAA
jgi:tRNA-specific 2-thiouridylase